MVAMLKIFITGPFRHPDSMSFNLKLLMLLESKGFSCYLPQRDTSQAGDRELTFRQNVEGIKKSDLIIAVGAKKQTANWGFEIGYAYALEKPIIILTETEVGTHLMTEGAAEVLVVDDADDLSLYADELLDRIDRLSRKSS
jgi:nucleoside 2-deoxyribosyltransferase